MTYVKKTTHTHTRASAHTHTHTHTPAQYYHVMEHTEC